MYIFNDELVTRIAKSRYPNPLNGIDPDDLSYQDWIRLLVPYVNPDIHLLDYSKSELVTLGVQLGECIAELKRETQKNTSQWKAVWAFQGEALSKLFDRMDYALRIVLDDQIDAHHAPHFLEIRTNDAMNLSGRPLMYQARFDVEDHSEYVFNFETFVYPSDVLTLFHKRKREIKENYEGDLTSDELDELFDEMQIWVEAFHELDQQTAAYAKTLGLTW